MKTKTIFKSKTAGLALITSIAGVVATFIPSVGEWVASNSNVILGGLGVISFIIRLVTKEKVSLFPESK